MASREPAPGSLRLLQEFENTADILAGEEALATPEALRDWLTERELLDQGIELTQADLEEALAAREAIRSLLFVNNGAPPDPEAAATLNRIAGEALLAVRFEADGRAELVAHQAAVGQALGRLLAIVVAARSEGTWARLKACRDDHCAWAFYDHSKNRAGAWCTMDSCGNRAKARAYRRRQSTTS